MKPLLVVLFALLLVGPAAADQAIHGYVNYDDHAANRLYMTTDDGRPMTVDITTSHSSPNGRKAGEAVLVYGTPIDATNFRASATVADRDRVQAPAAAVSGWQSLHGKVESLNGAR